MKKIIIILVLFGFVLLSCTVTATYTGDVDNLSYNGFYETDDIYLSGILAGYNVSFISGALSGNTYSILDNNIEGLIVLQQTTVSDNSFEGTEWTYGCSSGNIAEKSSENAHSGSYSTELRYQNTAGAAYTRHSSLNFTGAERVNFWAYNTKSTPVSLQIYIPGMGVGYKHAQILGGSGWQFVSTDITGFTPTGYTLTIGVMYNGDPAFDTVYIDDVSISYVDYATSGMSIGDNYTINIDVTEIPTIIPTATPTPTPTPTPMPTGETYIVWDASQYTQYTTAIITYSVSTTDWDSDEYAYVMRVLDKNGITVIREDGITTRPTGSTSSVFVDTPIFGSTGTYPCALVAIKKSTQSETILALDYAYVVLYEYVKIIGTTYNTTSASAIDAVDVSASQTGITKNTTSSSFGSYSFDGFYSSEWILLNSSKTGYTSTPHGFTPKSAGTFIVDLALIPSGGAEPGAWIDSGDGSQTDTTYSSVNTSYWTTAYGTSVGGYVYSGTLLGTTSGATVTLSNATWNDTYTTTSNGWYLFSELTNGLAPGSYTISASKDGYATISGTVVAVEDYFARKDFYLGIGIYTTDTSSGTNTTYWTTDDGTSCGGIAYLGPFGTVGAGVNITISNSTWSKSSLTASGGWYQFNESDGLGDDETYSMLVSKSGYDTVSATISCLADNFTRKDFYLTEDYSLTVYVKNLETGSLINNATITITLGDTTTTTGNGSARFNNLQYGVYSLSVESNDYYSVSSSVGVESQTDTETVYLQQIDTTPDNDGPATNYYPHPVKFTFIDGYGNPIDGATVTAKAIGMSAPWSWLTGIFGFDTNITDIQTTTLNGITGTDGTASFLMVEIVQYRVHCVKASAGINHTVDIYPKESEYFIRIGSLPLVGSYPTYSLNATTSGGNVILFGNYTDTSGSSSGVRFIVRNSTGSELYNSSVTLTGGVGSASYSVNNTKGTQLTFGITSEHTTHGHIEKWIDITLKGAGRLVDFGSGWTDFMYLAMSLAGIFLVAGCFGEIDTRLGAIFIPITAGMFWTIGWMGEVYGPLITIAGVLGALYYMRSKAKELDT